MLIPIYTKVGRERCASNTFSRQTFGRVSYFLSFPILYQKTILHEQFLFSELCISSLIVIF